MRILVVSKFVFAKGGDAVCALGTGRLLSDTGHTVSYWGMKHPDNPTYPLEEFFIDHVDLVGGGGRRLRTAANILYSREAKRKIRRVLDLTRPEVVHLHNFAHQISPSILDVLEDFGIPAVMTMHDYKLVCPSYSMLSKGRVCERCRGGRYYWCLLGKCTHGSYAKSLVNVLEMYLHHRILRIYDKIRVFISPSRFLQRKVHEMGFRGKVVHLPNFVALDQYVPRYEGDGPTIVYFGRLSSEKGLLTLLEAVRGLDVELRIIGDGPLRAELEAKASANGIDNVRFLGYRRGEDLRNEIRSAVATVVPSEWYENNPLSVIESFALGKPVVGARIGGIPELVTDGMTGCTFEPGNVGDLRAKLHLLTGDPAGAAEMGRTARSVVERHNSPEGYYERLMEIYQRACAGGRLDRGRSEE